MHTIKWQQMHDNRNHRKYMCIITKLLPLSSASLASSPQSLSCSLCHLNLSSLALLLSSLLTIFTHLTFKYHILSFTISIYATPSLELAFYHSVYTCEACIKTHMTKKSRPYAMNESVIYR